MRLDFDLPGFGAAAPALWFLPRGRVRTVFVTITTNPASKRFLVTAGNTREMIDSVRDWGNIFTGNTGLAIAKALASVGQVDLLTSNRAHIEELSRTPAGPCPIVASGYVSHAELKGALASLMARATYNAVFMTAAVADYRPAGVFEVLECKPTHAGAESWTVRDVQAGKVKSSYGTIAVLGVPTEKLVDLFRSAWGHRGLLVKFKLEVGVQPRRVASCRGSEPPGERGGLSDRQRVGHGTG